MRKQTLLVVAGVLLTATVQGQVGINTTSPKGTLDVVAKNTDGSTPEGLIAPRLTGDSLFAASGGTTAQYGVNQDGAIVYVTQQVSPGNDTGQTVNVNAPGYYYFDALANQWQKIGNGSNIYTTDGVLNNPRVMDMNSSTMGFVNGRMSVGVNTSHPSAELEVESTTRGFLPPRMTKAQVNAIANPAPGLVVYCIDFLGAGKGCLLVNDSVDPLVPKWGSMCSSNADTPVVLVLDCAARTVTGNLYQGQAAAGVTVTVPYTGGNGGVYQSVTFTGVNGLTAHLPSGALNTGNGSLTFTINGTPAATGNATFAIAVAGQSCSFTVPVGTLTASVGSINCGGASFTPSAIETGTPYSGTMTVPYSGGNGQVYPAVAPQVINGLTFTRQGGTLATGNGNFTYTVSGTPTSTVTMNIPVSFNGATSCNVSKAATTGSTVVIGGDVWMRHNLGADTSLDPDQNPSVKGLHGNYYQWGRKAPVANADIPPGAIAGWNTSPAPDGSWSNTTKTANDPCPAGFRVPTQAQMQNLISNTTQTNIGTFNNSPTNFTAAKVFTAANGNKLTFPAAGTRNSASGTLYFRGFNGYYWFSTQYSSTLAYHLFFNSTGVDVGFANLTFGFSVRCLAE